MKQLNHDGNSAGSHERQSALTAACDRRYALNQLNPMAPTHVGGYGALRIATLRTIGFLAWALAGLPLALAPLQAAGVITSEVERLTIAGEAGPNQASLTIQATLAGTAATETAIHATRVLHGMHASHDILRHAIGLEFDVLQGAPTEFLLNLAGDGDVQEVTGAGLRDWGVRQGPDGTRQLVLRMAATKEPVQFVSVTVTATTRIEDPSQPIAPLRIVAEPASLFSGYLQLSVDSELALAIQDASGITPLDPAHLPEALRSSAHVGGAESLAFRFFAEPYFYVLQLAATDPELHRVVLYNFQLNGRLHETSASFTLEAIARVRNPQGGSLNTLWGDAALTDVESHPDWRVRFEQGRYRLVFDRPGEYPVRLYFNARIRRAEGWQELDFTVAPSAMQPVELTGLTQATEIQFAGAARTERVDDRYLSHLPPNGQVKLRWRETRHEAEGRLFYAANALGEITIRPGLMRHTTLWSFQVIQGQVQEIELACDGTGEVTHVQGPSVLAWSLEPGTEPTVRRLLVRLNQAQDTSFDLQIQTQTALGNFPQAIDPIRLIPVRATRLGGYLRVINEGAVRLEVIEAGGLSQISPDQFPRNDRTRAVFSEQPGQVFAYRFSGPDYALRVQADNIIPELGVSQLLTYHIGETESVIEAELEIDIREAPVRELELRVPTGFGVARLQAAGLSDYSLAESAGDADAVLQLVYLNPIIGRQVIHLRLEQAHRLAPTNWTLPRVEVASARSVRGHVGVSADPGLRLGATRTDGLSETATAFFPKRTRNIQASFRINDPAWQAILTIERLAQSIQADVFHLFSIGEGLAYGSSVMNYSIAGAPMAVFNIELSDEYHNVEFIGDEIRNWQKTASGFEIQLHTPVAGPYSLLATFERPFRAQGETLLFTGARPLDAQTEQGYTVIISAFQFQVEPAQVSTGLRPLEPGEVPAEYRLLFDAPILGAYHYTTRPFELELDLKPLVQGDTVSQVVDRADITTRISESGQVLTDARYFFKSKAAPHLRVGIPPHARLWSVTVNGQSVVPIQDGPVHLVPLPPGPDPDTVQTLELKLADKSSHPKRLTVSAPWLSTPVLLTEWRLEPESGRRLVYRRGSLLPAHRPVDETGFGGLTRLFGGPLANRAWMNLVSALALVALATLVWRLSSREGTWRFSGRYWTGLILGMVASAIAMVLLLDLARLAGTQAVSQLTQLNFLAPIQAGGEITTVEVLNLPIERSAWALLGLGWPGLVGLVFWIYALLQPRGFLRSILLALGWLFGFWVCLRWFNAAPFVIYVGIGFILVHVVYPALRQLWQLPLNPSAGNSSLPATAVPIWIGALFLCLTQSSQAASPRALPPRSTDPAPAESVIQTARVEGGFVFVTAAIHWRAEEGQTLDLLHSSGVLTRAVYPQSSLKLVPSGPDTNRHHGLLALESGQYDLQLEYQTHVVEMDGQSGFHLPIAPGLINRIRIELTVPDVEVQSPHAVSIVPESHPAAGGTIADLVLEPVPGAWVGWMPRMRDTRAETTVFYAELSQLYAPIPGLIEGIHDIRFRPAQGEIAEVTFGVPEPLTITDVVASSVLLWRFDPDDRTLRVTLTRPQSDPFQLQIRSQIATRPLPYQQSIPLISVHAAAGQVGLLGVATGSEVQLVEVDSNSFTAIHLDDFPVPALNALAHRVSALTLRRAFRYSDIDARIDLHASAVEPDIRVASHETLSLGEDRLVLAAQLDLTITRAGIFKLSFELPTGLEVETIGGDALSHWTELKTEDRRVVTLHLHDKTEGEQQFAVTLVGPGARATNGWVPPRLIVREASKQTGQLVLVPEQGLRISVDSREGLIQLDPLRNGIRQKGVLAFRLLHAQWNLTLNIEPVAAWIQVSSLQDVAVTEGQAKVTANLEYQIENTGIQSFRVRLPASADSVRFSGEHITDYLDEGISTDNLSRTWLVKLQRRVIGIYSLRASFHLALVADPAEITLRGIQADDVNLQRGFLTLHSTGRLQVHVDAVPASLQTTEEQAIPRTLRRGVETVSAAYAFRLVDADFQLPVRLERYEPARLLPARVESVNLTSVIAYDGAMLTQVRIALHPGDKRLLHLILPVETQFWFAFVNQNNVWPWRQDDRILIPLDTPVQPGQISVVEFYYLGHAGRAQARALDLTLHGPRFDLPLENVTWQVSLDDKWRLDDWGGSLQFQVQTHITMPEPLAHYLENETIRKKNRTREAEQLLDTGNSLLAGGNPQQARRAFQAAYGLSQHDDAFNEDARVQLQNLKLQQALVGLNVRRQALFADPGTTLSPRDPRRITAYTQAEAKQILDRNTTEENIVLSRLAERLIQQQEAAVAVPAAIRAALPEHGRRLTFTRSLFVDPWAELRIELEAVTVAPARFFRFLLIAGLFLVMIIVLRVFQTSRTGAV